MNSEEIKSKLNDEINRTNNELGLDSTPTMYVNGEKRIGISSYDELKEFLELHGAKRK